MAPCFYREFDVSWIVTADYNSIEVAIGSVTYISITTQHRIITIGYGNVAIGTLAAKQSTHIGFSSVPYQSHQNALEVCTV